MDRHKKELALLFLLIMAFSFCPVYSVKIYAANDVSSESGSPAQIGGQSPVEITADPDIPVQGNASGENPEASSAAPPSSSPPSSASAPASSLAASSKQPEKEASSAVSGEVSSNVSGGEVSSELYSSEVSSEIVLPSVGSIAEDNPFSSVAGNTESQKRAKLIGVLSWACIILGILVVLIVVLSNRRPPRGPGRKRYHRTKRSRKKRLLSDKYYRGLNRY